MPLPFCTRAGHRGKVCFFNAPQGIPPHKNRNRVSCTHLLKEFRNHSRSGFCSQRTLSTANARPPVFSRFDVPRSRRPNRRHTARHELRKKAPHHHPGCNLVLRTQTHSKKSVFAGTAQAQFCGKLPFNFYV